MPQRGEGWIRGESAMCECTGEPQGALTQVSRSTGSTSGSNTLRLLRAPGDFPRAFALPVLFRALRGDAFKGGILI